MVLALPAKDARVSESPKKMIRTGREKRRHEAGERLQSSNFFFYTTQEKHSKQAQSPCFSLKATS
jgi:hypothetical protein